MSLKISELKASITIDCGELEDQLNELHNQLTSYSGIFGKLGMKIKAWRGEKKFKKIVEAAQDSAVGCIVDLRAKANAQTPWDTHALKESMYIEEIGSGAHVGYETGYDKDNAQNIRNKYGIIQHEVTSFRHPRGGKAKFLEDPYNANIMSYKADIKRALKGAIK